MLHPNPQPSGLPSGRAFLIAAVLFVAFLIILHASIFLAPHVFHRAFGAQHLIEIDPNAFTGQALSLPPVDLTLQDIITILADYDVVHESKLMTFNRWFGLTDPNTRTVFVNSIASEDIREETVIHELLHIIYLRKGIDTSGPYEPLIEDKAQELFKQLYGQK